MLSERGDSAGVMGETVRGREIEGKHWGRGNAE
jgi:hypothetical protein